MANSLVIGGQNIAPGSVHQIEIPVAKLCTDTDMSMPVYVIRGKKTGPTLFVSAAVHGDELNGIEIIRRLISQKNIRMLNGTLIAVPMVNIYGVLNQSRYMPDRRDLNRTFPGSPKGSLAGRVANQFLTEIVLQSNYGIDLHTGALHRTNIPQIRADLEDPETRELADAFGVPVLINANLRDGSLRQAAVENGTKILLYEAGEALRFDELSIQAGLKGILNILSHLGMIRKRRRKKVVEPFVATNSAWIRADASGIVRNLKQLGDRVKRGEPLAEIGNPYGDNITVIKAIRGGIIIGKQNIPLVQEGDAMFHVAYFEEADEVAEHIELLQDSVLPWNEPA